MAQHVVVAGGGVIGASCAYYLSQRGLKPTVVEACTPACSASGKAGGFLALDWNDASPLGPLARKSFQLHSDLAQALPDETGYRRVRTHSVAVRSRGARREPSGQAAPSLPSWVDPGCVARSSVIGSEETTAQVHPELFTRALLRAVERRGGSVRCQAAVVGVELGPGGEVAGVRVREAASGQEAVLPADAVVLAFGAWSTSALSSLLPAPARAAVPAISGLKVHSIVLADPGAATTADALFLSYRGPGGKSLEPEVYPRPDASVYVCGVSSEEEPPSRADQVQPRPGAEAVLRDAVAAVSKELADAEVLKSQACFLPCSEDGLPLIGAVPGVPGCYLAAGHGCWGILNAPATGLAVSELIVDGKSHSVDLAAFAPGRGSRTLR